MTGVKIVGVGHYAPERVVDNHDLEQWLDTTDEWITTRTGMKRRHWTSENEATSDLALAAARNALANAGLQPDDIDAYIVCTVYPDFLFPATACIVAAKLGAHDKPAFDMEIACSGFIYGLTVASCLIRAGVYRRVVLIGAETLSKLINREDRGTAILFGDGAGAVVLEASEEDSFLASELGSDGSRPELLASNRRLAPARLPRNAGPQGRPHSHERSRSLQIRRHEDDRSHRSGARESAPDQGRRRRTYSASSQQTHHRCGDEVSRDSAGRCVVNIQEYGNTSAASIPIALSEAVRDGRIKPNDVIVFVGFGGGLSWGAVVWKWVA